MERESRILDRETLRRESSRRERNCRWLVRYDSDPPFFFLHASQILGGLFSLMINNQPRMLVSRPSIPSFINTSAKKLEGVPSLYVNLEPALYEHWSQRYSFQNEIYHPKVLSLSLRTNQCEWHFDAIIGSLLIEQTCATDRSKWVTYVEESHRFVCTGNCMTFDR